MNPAELKIIVKDYFTSWWTALTVYETGWDKWV